MAKLPESTREWLEYYQAKYKKAFDNYQATGEKRYDNEAYRMEIIVDAFEAKLAKKADEDEVIRQRMVECSHVCDSLMQTEYTRQQVKDLLYKAVRW